MSRANLSFSYADSEKSGDTGTHSEIDHKKTSPSPKFRWILEDNWTIRSHLTSVSHFSKYQIIRGITECLKFCKMPDVQEYQILKT